MLGSPKTPPSASAAELDELKATVRLLQESLEVGNLCFVFPNVREF